MYRHTTYRLSRTAITAGEWLRELSLYELLSAKRLCKTWLIAKMFKAWHRNTRRAHYARIQHSLSSQSFLAKPLFCKAVLQLRTIAQDMARVQLLDIQPGKAYHLEVHCVLLCLAITVYYQHDVNSSMPRSHVHLWCMSCISYSLCVQQQAIAHKHAFPEVHCCGKADLDYSHSDSWCACYAMQDLSKEQAEAHKVLVQPALEAAAAATVSVLQQLIKSTTEQVTVSRANCLKAMLVSSRKSVISKKALVQEPSAIDCCQELAACAPTQTPPPPPTPPCD